MVKMHNTVSVLTQEKLDAIKEEYFIGPEFDPEVPDAGVMIKKAPHGYVGVYHQHILAGLRFPAFEFLETILASYSIHLSQISPNGLRKIISFTMLSTALGIVPDITLFRYFYRIKPCGDWIVFCIREDREEICWGLQTHTPDWKYEFFFIKGHTFRRVMEFGPTQGRGSDPSPDLTEDQKTDVQLLESNPVKWVDPDEVLLGMAGLSPYWNEKGKKPLYIVGGESVSLLTRLRGECPLGDVTVSEGHTLLDFASVIMEETPNLVTEEASTSGGEGLVEQIEGGTSQKRPKLFHSDEPPPSEDLKDVVKRMQASFSEGFNRIDEMVACVSEKEREVVKALEASNNRVEELARKNDELILLNKGLEISCLEKDNKIKNLEDQVNVLREASLHRCIRY